VNECLSGITGSPGSSWIFGRETGCS